MDEVIVDAEVLIVVVDGDRDGTGAGVGNRFITA